MDDRIGPVLVEEPEEAGVVLGDVDAVERNLAAGQLLPDLQSGSDGHDRRELLGLELNIHLAACQVVDDHDVVALSREMERRGPATKTIPTQNQDAQEKLPLKIVTSSPRHAEFEA